MFVSPYLITISFETFFINLPVVKVDGCVLILNLFGFTLCLVELLKLETNNNTFTHRIMMMNVQTKRSIEKFQIWLCKQTNAFLFKGLIRLYNNNIIMTSCIELNGTNVGSYMFLSS